MCFPFELWIVNPRIFVWCRNLTNCCNYLFCNCFLLFKSAVRRNTSTSKATDGETEKVIIRWLQLAPSRGGGRKERTGHSKERADRPLLFKSRKNTLRPRSHLQRCPGNNTENKIIKLT